MKNSGIFNSIKKYVKRELNAESIILSEDTFYPGALPSHVTTLI